MRYYVDIQAECDSTSAKNSISRDGKFQHLDGIKECPVHRRQREDNFGDIMVLIPLIIPCEYGAHPAHIRQGLRGPPQEGISAYHHSLGLSLRAVIVHWFPARNNFNIEGSMSQIRLNIIDYYWLYFKFFGAIFMECYHIRLLRLFRCKY